MAEVAWAQQVATPQSIEAQPGVINVDAPSPLLSDRTEDQVEAFLANAPPGSDVGPKPGLKLFASTTFSVAESLAILLASLGCLCILAPGYYLLYGSLQGQSINMQQLGKGVSLLCVLGLAWILYIYSIAFSRNAHSYDLIANELQVMDRESAPGSIFIGDLSHAAFGGLQSSWSAEKVMFPLRRLGDRVPHLYFMVFQLSLFLQSVVPLLMVSGRSLRFHAALPFWLLWSTCIYAPLCYWIQGGGWLAECVDSGSAVPTHVALGLTALAFAFFGAKASTLELERRLESPQSSVGIAVGGLLLVIGTFLVSAGRTASGQAWPFPYFLNTFLAGSLGLLTWAGLFLRKSETNWNLWPLGFVSGAAAIAAGSAYVPPVGAMVIGLSGSLCAYLVCNRFSGQNFDWRWVMFGTHGVSGLVGLALVGVFSSADIAGADVNGRPLVGMLGGNLEMLRVQCLTGGVAIATVLLGVCILLPLSNMLGIVLERLFSKTRPNN